MNKFRIILARVGATLRGKVVLLVLVLFTVFVIGLGILPLYRWHVKRYDIRIAAGSSKAESFALMEALQFLMGSYYPRIHISVFETSGVTESLRLLDLGEVQLAIAQADIPPGGLARTVAVLFQDRFQVLVHRTPRADFPVPAPKRTPAEKTAALPVPEGKKSCVPTDSTPILHFSDLKGKTIALQKSGAQFKSFLFVAAHYGLKETDFHFVGGDEESANSMFDQCDADAAFRVRSLHTADIQQLLQGGGVGLIPIDDTAALQEMNPAYQEATIPKGYFVGDPANPPEDLKTLGTSRLLLARNNVDDEVIYAITQALMDHRSELALEVRPSHQEVRPLAALFAEPTVATGGGAPIHPGAVEFYHRDQSSFAGDHADFLVWLTSLFVLVALCTVEFRRTINWNRKHFADAYNAKMLTLMREAETSSCASELVPIHVELTAMMAAIIQDLAGDKITQESFQSLNTVWQLSMESLVRRQYALDHQRDKPEEIPQWPLARLLHPRTRN